MRSNRHETSNYKSINIKMLETVGGKCVSYFSPLYFLLQIKTAEKQTVRRSRMPIIRTTTPAGKTEEPETNTFTFCSSSHCWTNVH